MKGEIQITQAPPSSTSSTSSTLQDISNYDQWQRLRLDTPSLLLRSQEKLQVHMDIANAVGEVVTIEDVDDLGGSVSCMVNCNYLLFECIHYLTSHFRCLFMHIKHTIITLPCYIYHSAYLSTYIPIIYLSIYLSIYCTTTLSTSLIHSTTHSFTHILLLLPLVLDVYSSISARYLIALVP